MRSVAAVLLTPLLACASAPAPRAAADGGEDPDAPAPAPFAELRARPTALVRHGPAPGSADAPALVLPSSDEDPGVRWERTRYPSGGRELLAFVARPVAAPRASGAEAERLPAVVYFHGGFRLAQDDLAFARPFVQRGFVVLVPTLRGENGNAGDFELLYGELEDAKAAARFLAQEPDVDVDRLYAVGHSVGGGLCALLAVDGDVPFKRLAAIGGVYGPDTFPSWQRDDPARTPFDLRDPLERRLRALTPFVEQVRIPLVLYVGKDDAPPRDLAHRVVEPRARAAGVNVTVVDVPGDHVGSIAPALELFAQLIEKDATASSARPVASAWAPRARAAARP